MTRLTGLFLAAILGASGHSVYADGNDSGATVARLEAALDATRSVSIYYIGRTGNYSMSPEQMKANAGTRATRTCGARCRNAMNAIVSHLKDAVPAKCMDGQENILFVVDGNYVTYSYSGRIIKLFGSCFFNKESFTPILKVRT